MSDCQTANTKTESKTDGTQVWRHSRGVRSHSTTQCTSTTKEHNLPFLFGLRLKPISAIACPLQSDQKWLKNYHLVSLPRSILSPWYTPKKQDVKESIESKYKNIRRCKFEWKNIGCNSEDLIYDEIFKHSANKSKSCNLIHRIKIEFSKLHRF